MKNPFRKLHTSEVLLLVAYAVMIYSFYLVEQNAGEDFELSFYTFIAIVPLSFWSVWRHRTISPVLWPFYISLGYGLGALLGSFGGTSGAPAAIGFFICLAVLFLVFVELICGIVFATKDAYKMLILVILSFLVTLTLDRIFITSYEMGEKGPSFYLQEYSDWRILEPREGF